MAKWRNCFKKIGYPRNKKALPKLSSLLQDRNWPGSLEAIEIFKDLGKKISISYIERECEQALTDKEDFNNPATYEQTLELAEK